MLEWPRLSRLVSSFASTSLGSKRLQVLELPPTRAGSETLLSETQAALEFEALRGGACDLGTLKSETLQASLRRATKGAAFSGEEAAALGVMLQLARTLRNAALSCSQQNKIGEYEHLRPVLSMLSSMEFDSEAMTAIWSVVNEDGTVKDSASSELKQARMDEQAKERKLQDFLMRLVSEKLGSDPSAEVVRVGNRYCVALSSGNSSKVPGLLLQSSFGGVVSYIEPSPAVSLNNILSQAKAETAQAEYRVLLELTNQLQAQLENFRHILHTIVEFDVMLGRARYSSSLGAVRPEFSRPGAEFLLRLEGAKHPLLVQQHQEHLQNAKSKLADSKKVLGRLKRVAYAKDPHLDAAEQRVAEAQAETAAAEASSPVPIDFLVKQKTKVVVITGPNTGGKTAAAKTLGMSALMAKAGIYVIAREPACVPWFDKVLADIGDEQSLNLSLSTFSGHLQRVKRIAAEATGSSLIFLDEVGTGTDFVEGAALGMALLESFAEGRCLLTIATTHHGQLKMLKYTNTSFENACVEFDDEKLRPTYRLVWGIQDDPMR